MNHSGNKEVALFVGVDPDKSEATQRLLVGREIIADFHGEGDDDVGKFSR